MKKNFHSGGAATLLALLVFLGAGCEYKIPKSVWDPNADLGTAPTITSLVPEERAKAGVQTITIQGSGFPADPSRCTVYFGGIQTEVLASAENQIVVQRPNISADSITVNVVIQGVYGIAVFPGYSVDPVYRFYGNKNLEKLILLIDVDASENLYGLLSTKHILMIPPDESYADFALNSFRKKTTGMRIGPDGALYEIQLDFKAVYRIAPEGGESAKYADLPAVPLCFDFDAGGAAVFAGSNTGLFVLLSDLSTRTLLEFNDLKPIGLRCYKGQVFAYDGQAIWKTTLSADYSTAGPKEKVFDMAQAADYAGSKITSFVMDEDGSLIVSTDRTTGNPMLLVSAGGAVGVYYKGILPAYAGGQLMWGSGHYLYLNMQIDGNHKDVMRIDAGKNQAGK
jgi:hypothetical protein